jgi:hypothetical protein
MHATQYFIEDAIECPDHLRCEWCFDKATPTKPPAQLRVQLEPRDLDSCGKPRYAQLCLACWFKLAFHRRPHARRI